jgi:hypothetical protein
MKLEHIFYVVGIIAALLYIYNAYNKAPTPQYLPDPLRHYSVGPRRYIRRNIGHRRHHN